VWLAESEFGRPISLCVYVTGEIEQEQKKCASLLQRVCEQQVSTILKIGAMNVEMAAWKKEVEEEEEEEAKSTFGSLILFSPLMVSPPRLSVHLAMVGEAPTHHLHLLEMVANSIKSLQDMFASIRVVHTTNASLDDFISSRYFENVDTEAWVLEMAIVNETQAFYRFGKGVNDMASGLHQPMGATTASLRAHLRRLIGLPLGSSSSNSMESGDALLWLTTSSTKNTKSLLAWEVVWLQMAWTVQMRALAAERLDTTLTLLSEEPNIVVTSRIAQKLSTAHELLLLLNDTCGQDEEHRIVTSVQKSFLTCLDGLVLLNQIHADASLLPPLYFPWDQMAAIYFPYWVPLIIPSIRFFRGK